MTGAPRYTLIVPRHRPVLDPFRAVIDQWLKEEQDRLPQRRHTAHRIYDHLVSEFTFQGGESTVRQHVHIADLALHFTPSAGGESNQA